MQRLALLSFAAASLSMLTLMAPATAVQLKSTPKGGVSLIKKGGCCAKVHNACISTCTKNGGCTGNGDCVVLKAR